MPSKKKVDVTITTNPAPTPPTVTCDPDPVVVKKSDDKDGVKWVISDSAWVFTGVAIDGTIYTPSNPNGDGDFSGLSIDNSNANKSVMSVDDSLAEITGPVHSADHTYTISYQARSGGQTYSFDPTIRNEN